MWHFATGKVSKMRGRQEQNSRDVEGEEQQAHGFKASVTGVSASSVISFGR